MKKLQTLFIALSMIFYFGNILVAQTQKTSPFPEGTKRVLFLGNSITYGGKYITDVETYFKLHYPDYNYEFINAGLPSETVSGLSEEGHANGEFPRPCIFARLNSLLEKTQADVVFICYGMNDGIYLPLDTKRFDAFKNGMESLYQKIETSGVKKIYVMTPTIHVDEKEGLNGYNRVLDTYSEWILSQKKTKKWDVIDLHFPMNQYLSNKRKSDPGFKLADDGVHPKELGHWLMAKQILLHLGQDVSTCNNIESTFRSKPNALQIHKEIAKRQQQTKDAWLTYIGHERPGMNKGLPIEESKRLYDKSEKIINSLLKDE